MDLINIVIVAIALSMDSFAVSIVNGLTNPKLRFTKAIGIASIMALFQGSMPLLGWYLGNVIESQIESIDHWLAFVLLSFIGSKMIYDGMNTKNETLHNGSLKFNTLIIQSVATSIDALVVGLSFAFVEIDIFISVIIIGAITFLFSMIGLKLGKVIGDIIKGKIEIFGGGLLILIGLKIVIEHLFFQ